MAFAGISDESKIKKLGDKLVDISVELDMNSTTWITRCR